MLATLSFFFSFFFCRKEWRSFLIIWIQIYHGKRFWNLELVFLRKVVLQLTSKISGEICPKEVQYRCETLAIAWSVSVHVFCRSSVAQPINSLYLYENKMLILCRDGFVRYILILFFFFFHFNMDYSFKTIGENNIRSDTNLVKSGLICLMIIVFGL